MTKSKGIRQFLKSEKNITSIALNYIDGLVLSDGHIHKGIKTGQYMQKCKHKEWLDKIKGDLYSFSIESNVNNGKLMHGGFFNGLNKPEISGFNYSLWTKSYIEFKELRERWYKEWYLDLDDGTRIITQKIVPKDICLNQECVANWYLGDGSIIKHYCDSYRIEIATMCFKKEEVVFLSETLNNVLEINSYVDKRNAIYIGKLKDIISFIEYIKDYKVDCYSYKFPDRIMEEIYD